MRIPRSIRSATGPLLLLAAAAAAGTGTAAAAAADPDLQYLGRDDRVHSVLDGSGCVPAEGGGSRAVVNRTARSAQLYREPGCQGTPAAVVLPGASAPVAPVFDSLRFTG
ncbi:hypothetical protein [Streptomyces sp. NPDC051211]|uniref:hypothetical protein n=1 Tax=Streptomyces sp. NPDC051211 TaxID=3154643 RepID=UPI00344E8AA2